MYGEEFNLPLSGATHKSWPWKVTYKKEGWKVLNPPHVGGDCNKMGYDSNDRDVLKKCFSQDGVIYPSNIHSIFETLWENIDINEYSTKEEVQEKFNEIGEWIVSMNKNRPKDLG